MKTSLLTDIRAPESTTFSTKVIDQIKRTAPVVIVWWCFALSILCSSISRYSTESSGAVYALMVIMGSGACAWLWLLTRSLFRPRKDWRPAALYGVAVVVAMEAAAGLIPPSGSVGLAAEAGRVLVNTASMICIAAIVFIYNEALQGYSKLSAAERRFRVVFIGVLSLVIGVAILWVSGARAGTVAANWNAVLLTSCGALALIGSRLAVQYRLKNPQQKAGQCETDQQTLQRLGARILKAINDDELLTTPNLKVSAFADRIKEQEYKVTRCITNHLQYRNFNHLLNSHRIDRAKGIFDEPKSDPLTIATVAYACGFNSLGPFNRAFKQYTGMTPREYRQQCAAA